MYFAQNISKMILKKEHTTSSGTGKIQPPRHLAKLSIWSGGLGIFDIDPQINYIIRMHLKVIKSQQCSVERSHVALKLILNSDQGLALFRQKQILTGLLSHKKFTKKVIISLFSDSMRGYI